MDKEESDLFKKYSLSVSRFINEIFDSKKYSTGFRLVDEEIECTKEYLFKIVKTLKTELKNVEESAENSVLSFKNYFSHLDSLYSQLNIIKKIFNIFCAESSPDIFYQVYLKNILKTS